MVAIRLTRVHTYKRSGPMKEVDVPPNATYLKVAVIGAKALGIHEDMTFDGRWALFHIDGTVISEEAGWTVGAYMSSLNRGPSRMRLGVGILYEVS